MNIANPVLMLLGDADDIADPTLCDALVESSPIKGLITVRHYPEVRHGFDIQGAPSVLGLRNGKTVGYQKAAANDAWKELTAFIARRLDQSAFSLGQEQKLLVLQVTDFPR